MGCMAEKNTQDDRRLDILVFVDTGSKTFYKECITYHPDRVTDGSGRITGHSIANAIKRNDEEQWVFWLVSQ